jgi:hypothetical protein
VGGMGWGMGGSEVASLSPKLPRHVWHRWGIGKGRERMKANECVIDDR